MYRFLGRYTIYVFRDNISQVWSHLGKHLKETMDAQSTWSFEVPHKQNRCNVKLSLDSGLVDHFILSFCFILKNISGIPKILCCMKLVSAIKRHDIS